ncbi:Xaa-Pro dipeptidyl-peptidase [Streptomyces albogriseolus]|uniref:Xaa-Pro dipeptidyl-peptidase n=1 Tax=Streptomyces albogriseolus TaxID=1887 RepID=UPI00345F50D6
MPIRTRPTTWRTLATAATAALTATLLTPAAADAAPRDSRPVHSYADAVREAVWVDTGLDEDRDGRTDRVAVDIVRPREAARKGRKVPVIMDASPYYSCCGRGNESQTKTYDGHGDIVRMPLFYDNFFVPRGYAVVGVDLAGTSRSDGCVDVGGRSDIRSAKAVVDWLNGRAKAYSSRTGGEPVRADWTDGSTGMIGKSWDGTIANGVAATGVEGLKTIVPIAAISTWYDYYFSQGAPLYGSGPDRLARYVQTPEARENCAEVARELVDGAPRTGDRTPLWTARDYVRAAKKVRASVFLVHGMQDLNVRMQHVGPWWDALGKNGVRRKIWLSQTGHVDPFDFRRAEWVHTLHRWFDHELKGIDNGIDREPVADIERAPDEWVTSAAWPPRGTHTVTLRPARGAQDGVGTLGRRPDRSTATFTDDPALGETDWAARIDTPTPEKAGFVTRPLTRGLRLAGSSRVTVTVTPSTPTAHLSAVLVDLGPDTVRDYGDAGEGIVTLPERTCWGPSTEGDSSCYRETRAKTADVGHTVVSRGWADLARTSARVPFVGGAAAFARATSGPPVTAPRSAPDGVRPPATAHRVPGETR